MSQEKPETQKLTLIVALIGLGGVIIGSICGVLNGPAAAELVKYVLYGTPTVIATDSSPTPTFTCTPTATSILIPLAKPTPTSHKPPTKTPTPTNTPTSTPTPTPTPTKPDAVVNAEALNLRSGPGTVYDILGVLKRGDCLEVIGRNLACDWLKVFCLDRRKRGWVAASYLQTNKVLTAVPVAQAPPTPTPMYTPAPVATPTPTLLPPPILTEPENGATFIGGPVILKWQWDYRPRAPDEIFSLRVCKDRECKKGETEPCHHYQPRDLEYWGDLMSYCSEGKHYWGVTLVRQLCTDCPEEEMWQDLSEPSAQRWIYYVPGEEPWTWPTPSDDDDNDGTGQLTPPP